MFLAAKVCVSHEAAACLHGSSDAKSAQPAGPEKSFRIRNREGATLHTGLPSEDLDPGISGGDLIHDAVSSGAQRVACPIRQPGLTLCSAGFGLCTGLR